MKATRMDYDDLDDICETIDFIERMDKEQAPSGVKAINICFRVLKKERDRISRKINKINREKANDLQTEA